MIEPFELLGALLGAIFLAGGAGAAILSRLRTARADVSLLSFGAFTMLYGARLLVRSAVFREAFGVSVPLMTAVEAVITYWILVPMGILAESLLGRGRWGVLRRAWQITTLYATGAVAWDILTDSPGEALVLNPYAVLGNMTVALSHLIPRLRRVRWTREGRALAAAAALFSGSAAYETLFGGIFGDVNLEPLAMLVLVVALGVFVSARSSDQERRLAVVTRELETARQIQQSLLPRTLPDAADLRLAARYLPTGAVAGDLYDATTTRDGGIAIVVADVSGHGVPAAIIASMVKAAFAAESEHAGDPARVLGGMNRALCGKFERAYVTAVAAYVTNGGAHLRYACAGHPPPLVRRADGRVETLDGSGLLLGFDPAASYSAAGAALAPGDRLLLCTDGLLEAERGDVLFGEGELQRTLERTNGTLDELADTLVTAAGAWAGRRDAPLSDDLTLVLIEALPA